MPRPLLFALIWTALVSLTTLIAFARDKRRAKKGKRRTPEVRLHLLELLGGWPGALVAMALVRHKNAKPKFYLVTVLISALHVAAWIVGIWWWLLRP